ncbi:MAG: ROK family protein [Planctomycetaceae bacterium]|nr:ROK family protein [Planctomycetaceae bacterium]
MILTPQVRDKLDMKLHNRTTIWDLIYSFRPVSRAQLAKITEMSPTSITRIVGELMDFGLLREEAATNHGLGRKATMLDVDQDAFYTLGIAVDAGFIQTCLLDLDNRPRSVLECATRGRPHSPSGLLDRARVMYRDMLTATGLDESRVKAGGISVVGMVDREKGEVVVSRPLTWPRVPLQNMAETVFGIPFTLENDVKAAVYEEYLRHEECRLANVAYLAIGSGVGSALMYNGAVLRGVNNVAGAIGHITVQPDGERCDCGRRGCFSTYLTEKAVLARIRSLTGQPAAGMEKWHAARRRGERWAAELGEELGRHVAYALNHIICSYDPQMIILGGKLFQANPDLLDLALSHKDIIHDELRSGVRILHSLSGGQESVIGAALRARSYHLEKLLRENL